MEANTQQEGRQIKITPYPGYSEPTCFAKYIVTASSIVFSHRACADPFNSPREHRVLCRAGAGAHRLYQRPVGVRLTVLAALMRTQKHLTAS